VEGMVHIITISLELVEEQIVITTMIQKVVKEMGVLKL